VRQVLEGQFDALQQQVAPLEGAVAAIKQAATAAGID
jgi:hypothetical protein